ncbi:MAG: DUF6514 family protein [Lachnospiraceae bacterium]
MKNTQEVCETTLLDQKGRNYLLKYYLLETASSQEEALYGIMVEKCQVHEDGCYEVVEQDRISVVSDSKKFVEKTISTLCQGQVTPIGMTEIVDDMMTHYINDEEEECEEL